MIAYKLLSSTVKTATCLDKRSTQPHSILSSTRTTMGNFHSSDKYSVLPGTTGQVYKVPAGYHLYDENGTRPDYHLSLGGELMCNACLENAGQIACPRCGVPRYCSVNCQQTHWKVHKHGCVGASPSTFTIVDNSNEVDPNTNTIPWLSGRVFKARRNGRIILDDTYTLYEKVDPRVTMQCNACREGAAIGYCPRCLVPRYCSLGCEREHRKIHKYACKPASEYERGMLMRFGYVPPPPASASNPNTATTATTTDSTTSTHSTNNSNPH